MHPVVLRVHADPFLRSNEPEARIPPILSMIMCYSSRLLLMMWIFYYKNDEISHGNQLTHWLYSCLALTTMQANFQGQASPEARVPPVLPMIVCYSSTALFVIRIYNFKKAEISHGRLFRHCLFSWISLTAMLSHYKGQTSFGVHSHLFANDRVLLLTIFGGDLDCRLKYCRNFSWTSVKNFTMQPVDPYGHADQFL